MTPTRFLTSEVRRTSKKYFGIPSYVLRLHPLILLGPGGAAPRGDAQRAWAAAARGGAAPRGRRGRGGPSGNRVPLWLFVWGISDSTERRVFLSGYVLQSFLLHVCKNVSNFHLTSMNFCKLDWIEAMIWDFQQVLQSCFNFRRKKKTLTNFEWTSAKHPAISQMIREVIRFY